jgi:hypothetical protein
MTGKPEPFPHDYDDFITADDEFGSLDEVLAESDIDLPVSKAVRQSEAPAAFLTEPKHASDEQKGRTDHSCIIRTSRSSHPGDLAQKCVTRSDNDESTEAAASHQHDLRLLQLRPEKAQEMSVRNQKAWRERLKVRLCVRTARFMHAMWNRGTR